jgi:hypothetical protein
VNWSRFFFTVAAKSRRAVVKASSIGVTISLLAP